MTFYCHNGDDKRTRVYEKNDILCHDPLQEKLDNTYAMQKHYLLPRGESVAGGDGPVTITSSLFLPIGRSKGCIALVISYSTL